MPTRTVTLTAKRQATPEELAALPPLRVQVRSLAEALRGTVARAVSGKRIRRTPAHQAACLAVCRGCEEWREESQRCGKCGCFGAFKSWVAASNCPLGKWPAVEVLGVNSDTIASIDGQPD